jgi:hypothetical protein
MGMVTEGEILRQAKKSQGETNERLDKILKAVEAQNELLRKVLAVRV